MSSNELLIRLGVDTSNADKQLKAIKNELKDLGKLINTVDDATEDYNKSANGLSEKLNLQIRTMKTYNTQLEVQQKQLKEYREGLEKSKQKLEELNNAHTKDADAIKKTEALISGYTKQIAKMENDIEQTTASMQAMNREITATQKSLSGLKWSTWGKQIEKFGKGLKNAGELISNLGSKLAPLSTAAAGALGYIAKTAMDFESAITQVAVTSQATEEELEHLKEAAITLGEELPISSSEAAEGLNYLALAGYTVEEQLTAIEPVAKASVAWNADLATVSDMATDSLSAMSLTVNDLGRYMDVVSTAQMKSNTTALALMEAYIEVGGSLAQLNVPLEESAALLGIMANRGIKGREAGRALNAVLINLTAGTSKSLGALEELNVETFDAQGNFRGLENILNDLNKALADCTQEEKNSYLAMIGGKQHVGDLNALLAGLSEEYGELKIELTESSGALNKMTDMMSETTAMRIEELKGKIESLAIKLGETLLPYVEKFVDWLTDLVDKFSNLSPKMQETVLQVMAFTAVLSPAVAGLGSLTKGIGSVVEVVGKLAKLIGGKGGLAGLFGQLPTSGELVANTFDDVALSSGGLMTTLKGIGTTAGGFTLTGVSLLALGLAALGVEIGAAVELFDFLANYSYNSTEGIYTAAEASAYLKEVISGMDGSLESTKNAIVEFGNISLSTWGETMHNQTAISEEGYATITTAATETHNAIMKEMEQRRTEVPALARMMYADELAAARLSGDEEVRIVEEKIAKKEKALYDAIDRETTAENNRFNAVMQNAEWALDKRYATDENFRTQSAKDWEIYYQNANRIFGTGEAVLYSTVEEANKSLGQMITEYSTMRTDTGDLMYKKILEQADTAEQAELDLLEASHQDKLAMIEGYTDEELKMFNTSREELKANEKASYLLEKESIENHFEGLRGVAEEHYAELATLGEADRLLRLKLDQEGYALSEAEYEHFYERMYQIANEGNLDELEISTQVLDEIKKYREQGYLDIEETALTHNENLKTATKDGLEGINEIVHQGIGGPINTIEEADFGTAMSNNMTEMKTAIEGTDLVTPTGIMLGGIGSEVEYYLGTEIPIITATGLGTLGTTIESTDLSTPTYNAFSGMKFGVEQGMLELPFITNEKLGVVDTLIQGYDFLTPTAAAFGLVPLAIQQTMPTANTEVQTGLDTMGTTLNSWDIGSAMSMPREAFITSVNTMMTDSNTATQTGLTVMDTTIQSAPFEASMTEQGEKMITATTNYYETLKNVTDNGLKNMDSLIIAAPFQSSMLNQGDLMASAQESNMDELVIKTSTGMYEVLSTMQEVWGNIVSWWNSQSLESKEVNINVRTNYSSSGTPSTYSNGVAPSEFSTYEAQTFNAVGYGLARTLPSMDTYDIPSYTNTGYSEYVTGEKGSSNDIENLLSDQVDLLSQLVKQNNGKSVNVNVDTMELTGAKNADEAQLAMVRFWSKL